MANNVVKKESATKTIGLEPSVIVGHTIRKELRKKGEKRSLLSANVWTSPSDALSRSIQPEKVQTGNLKQQCILDIAD